MIIIDLINVSHNSDKYKLSNYAKQIIDIEIYHLFVYDSFGDYTNCEKLKKEFTNLSINWETYLTNYLISLTNRESIFYTETFSKYENIARRNIQNELKLINIILTTN
jgi:predicted metal-dependent HD superfamily phosphohydrolase